MVSNNPWVPWEYFCQALVALLDSDSKHFGAGYGNEPEQRLKDIYWERRAYRDPQGITQGLPRWDMSSGQTFEGHTQLLDLLVTKRGSEASDSRDMVFALTRLAARPKTQISMSTTYNWSPLQVYKRTVRYLLENEGNYEVLIHAGLQQSISSSLSGLPLWAPDWQIRNENKYKIIDWVPANSSFVDDVKLNHTFIDDQGILSCAGHIIDTIHCVSDRSSEELKLAPGNIRRVIWDQKLYRRELIEHGVHSTLETKLGSIQSLFARSHPLTYKRKLAKIKRGILCLVRTYCAGQKIWNHHLGLQT